MIEKPWRHIYKKIINGKKQFPASGHIELTYECNLSCGHCYCKGSEDQEKELTSGEWKKIFNDIQKAGCIGLTLTGGEPLLRSDFLDIYAYAKEKGFVVVLFTNGQALTQKVIDYFVKSPPHCIEITLNGITKPTYEAITQVEGSFEKVIFSIQSIRKKKLPLILKSNCLVENKNEIGKIKAFTDDFLGKPGGKHRFKYDQVILPRLNGDKTPCRHRLSFKEILEMKKQDIDIWEEYRRCLHGNFPSLKRNRAFLYHCNSWTEQFFINPFGYLKFCLFSQKFSVDLKTTSFKEGFYKVFPKILKERFKTNSKCRNCRLRPICQNCPARAYLECGNEEAPAEYYCRLAEGLQSQLNKR